MFAKSIKITEAKSPIFSVMVGIFRSLRILRLTANQGASVIILSVFDWYPTGIQIVLKIKVLLLKHRFD